ncbi:MAG: DEAD/DEAH box helicase family protein, partial [Rhizobiaceae bacterium]
MQTVTVLLPIPVERAYSYAVPQGMVLQPGDIVQVPIGPRMVAAAVWDGPVDDVDPGKLKQVEKKFDCPGLDENMRRFVDWVANYYVMPAGMVLKMVLRVPEALEPPGSIAGLRYSGGEPDRMTKARQAVLELAREGGAWTKSGLAHAAGVSASVVSGLSDMGIFEPVEIPLPRLTHDPDPDFDVPDLNEMQQEAAAKLRTSVYKGGFSATLIDGVTGSGKTEVYFEAVSAALKAGKQVLILLPEISLTTSFLERFEQRFGTRPAEWHSEISPKKRERCWRQVATGQIRVVAGARSALFLP